jgi:hypothetical protein
MRPTAGWTVSFVAIAGLFVVLWHDHLDQERIVVLQAQAEANRQKEVLQIAALKRQLVMVRSLAAAAEKKLQAAADDAKVRRASSRQPSDMIFSISEARKDPAYTAFWHKEQLRNIWRQYGDELTKLNLSADELAKVKNLLVERQEASMDAREAGLQAGLDRRTVNQATQAAAAEVNNEIKADIGQDAFMQLEQSGQSGMVKQMIGNQLGVDLSAAGFPLTNDQLSSLAAIYAQAIRPVAGLPPGRAIDPETGLNPASQATLDQAARILTPSQLPLLRDYLLEQIAQQKYFQKRATASGPGN